MGNLIGQFVHLRALDGPLRLPDLGEYVTSLGLAPGLIACRTFQGTPMRHRGLDVGHFFLGEKAGGAAFTVEDEEVLVVFAAKAAIAIANARAHREERRAPRPGVLPHPRRGGAKGPRGRSLGHRRGPGHRAGAPGAALRSYAELGGPDRARDAAGFGLGLVICKWLVEAHGGRVRAESAGAGLGTRFTFTLPVAEAPGAAGLAPAPSPPTGAGRGKTPVLLVDDDPKMLRRVRDALAAAGYALFVTGDPEEVAPLVRTHRPQLVVLDLVLPDTDGIELMRTVPELCDLPVIFISAYGRDETVVRALEAGAADYVVKPFSDAELTARVRAALRRRAGAEPFVLGELAIDHERRRVTVGGRAVHLTPHEYGLLRILSLDAGRVVTYASLLRRLWADGEEGEGSATEPVRGGVERLRRKLGEDAARPAWILNVRGVGYRMPRPGEG